MKWPRLCVVCVAALWGCGDADDAPFAPAVRLHGLSAAQVNTLAIFVLGPTQASGVALPCDSLTARDPQNRLSPTDPGLDLLTQGEFSFGAEQGSFLLEGVKAGVGRLILVQALNALEQVVGLGCRSGITVVKKSTTDDIPPVVVYCADSGCD